MECSLVMYMNWKLTVIFSVGLMWGCAAGPSSGEGLSLVIKVHAPLLGMPLYGQGSLPVDIPACLCCRVVLSLHLLKLWQQGCSVLTPCILELLVVSFLCRRFPYPMPTLLDVPVGVLPGKGVCLPCWYDWALPAHWYDWVLPVLFPFCCKGYIDVLMWWALPAHWYDWVLPVPRSSLLFSLLSPGVYWYIALL